MGYRSSLEAKIFEKEALADRCRQWQAAGDKLVFTNGCFDILHLGHIDYLNRAADLGNHLVVGVNTDASVSRLKGPNRPIQDEYARLRLLAALACVSAVVLFDEPTPLALIELIRPDILVKGADYSLEQIVGAREVLSWGGDVKTIELVKGYATSAIEARIKAQA
jgi:rfaE bifunctional protein nucleotidyltransferase chain/domain